MPRFYYLLLSILHLLNSGASSLSTPQENKQKYFLLLESGTICLGLERIYTNVHRCTHTHTFLYTAQGFLSCFLDYRSTETHRKVWSFGHFLHVYETNMALVLELNLCSVLCRIFLEGFEKLKFAKQPLDMLQTCCLWNLRAFLLMSTCLLCIYF